MSMEKVIRFRKGIESLSESEFNSCIESLTRETLTTLVFRGLLHQLDHDASRSQNDIDVLLSTIKNLRELRRESEKATGVVHESDSKAADSGDVNLDDLPNVLLSEISSYLQFEDHLNFQTTSRTIFIGSRSSPLPIHSLTASMCRKLITFRHHHSSSFLPQPIFKSVTIDCQNLVERRDEYHDDGEWSAINELCFEPSGLEFIKRAESLTIDLGSEEDWKEREALDSVLKNIILKQSRSFPNLNVLRVHCGDEDLSEQMPYFERLIRRSNLEFIEFTGNCSDDRGFRSYKWARNLKGIAFQGNGFSCRLDESSITRKVQSAMTDTLESLHVVEPLINDDFKGKLGNLKEICIKVDNDDEIENDDGYRMLLNEDMTSLMRIHFHKPYWSRKPLRAPFVLWLHKALKTVEYFCCDLFSLNMQPILETTRSVLSTLPLRKRQLKIRVNYGLYSYPEFDCTTLIEPMKQLIAVMHSKCDEWSFILYGIRVRTREQSRIEQFRKAICSLNEVDGYNAILNLREDVRMDIVVRSHQMSGIHEPWIMTCNDCRSAGVVFE